MTAEAFIAVGERMPLVLHRGDCPNLCNAVHVSVWRPRLREDGAWELPASFIVGYRQCHHCQPLVGHRIVLPLKSIHRRLPAPPAPEEVVMASEDDQPRTRVMHAWDLIVELDGTRLSRALLHLEDHELARLIAVLEEARG